MPHQGHGNGNGHADDGDEEPTETSALLCADIDFSKVSGPRLSAGSPVQTWKRGWLCGPPERGKVLLDSSPQAGCAPLRGKGAQPIVDTSEGSTLTARSPCTLLCTRFVSTSLPTLVNCSFDQASQLTADTPLTYDQLIAPDSTYTIIRPLTDKYIALQNPSVGESLAAVL